MILLLAALLAATAICFATASSIRLAQSSLGGIQNSFCDGDTEQLAPMSVCDRPPERLVTNRYAVMLSRDYSLEDHKRTVVGAFPDGAIILVDEWVPRDVWYSAIIENAGALDKIRADPGVQFVECVGWGTID